MLRVGIIGLGDISKIHIPAIEGYPEAQLVAACDIDEALRAMVPQIPFYSDYHQMLKEEQLDCVHICLPHHLHYPVTKAVVEHGVHVLLEKPLAHTLADSRAIVALEQAHPEVKIGVSLQNRLNETIEELQSIVQSGRYGKLIGVKGLVAWQRPKEYYETKPWRSAMVTAGGGVMINQSIHTLDLMQFIAGEIESIRGSIDQLLDYGYDIEDTASAHIKFQNGATGLFFATIANDHNDSVEFQVTLEEAQLTIKDSVLMIDQENKQILSEDQKLPGTKFYYGASHMKLIAQFYQQIVMKGDDYIHANEAQTSIEMIDLIYRSSQTKQTLSFADQLKRESV